jgi:uracil-DNA glycosylase family 4
MADISKIYVPSEGNPKSKLWIIGEAPGFVEEKERRPFVGESGKLLESVLARHGVLRSDVFFTNLCHYRPPGNKFQALIGSSQLVEGLGEIDELLQDHRPNLICGLGNYPLYYLTNREGISKYRGSILDGKLGIKTICTYHPAFILRNRAAYPVLDVDIARIASDAKFPELNLPKREIIIAPTNLDYWVERILQSKYVSCDIESVKGSTEILCVGFGLSADLGVVIPHDNTFASRNAIETILSSNVSKVFHFGTYDVPVLRNNGYTVNHYDEDTIIQAHVLAPELPRDLGYLVSVETREPYFKQEGKKNIPGDIKAWGKRRNKEDLYAYNGKDICTTIEIFYKQQEYLIESGQMDYYRYRMELQNEVALPLSENGFEFDSERRDQIATFVRKDRAKYIIFLNTLAGYPVNAASSKQLCKLFYETLGLPVRKKTNRKTGKTSLTSDEDATVSLIGYCLNHISKLKTDRVKEEWLRKLHILKLTLKIKGYDKLDSSYFKVTLHNGRMKSLYKVSGTETGRLAMSKYVDGSGLNISTIPREAIEIG